MNLTNLLPHDPRTALKRDNFLVLRMPDELERSVAAAIQAGLNFFHEPVAIKEQFKFQQGLGYRPFGGEYSISADVPDQLESFSVSPRLPVSDQQLNLPSAHALQRQMSDTFDLIEPILESLTVRLCAQITGVSGDHLRGQLRQWSRLQMNYSRPSEIALPFINETHEDLDLLTLTCAPPPGLEVQIGSRFVPIQCSSSEMIVFPGEIGWLLSGGELLPVYHRVRPSPYVKERVSLLFFADPEPTRCNPWIITKTNQGIDIGDRVRMNDFRFGLAGFRDDSVS